MPKNAKSPAKSAWPAVSARTRRAAAAPEPTPQNSIPLADRVVRVDPRPRYMPFRAPANGDPEVEDLLWLHAALAEALRRGIDLSASAVPGSDPEPALGYPDPLPAVSSVRTRRSSPPPDPSRVRTRDEFHTQMRRLRRWAGTPQPTLRELERLAAEVGRPVSRATFGRALNGQAWPTIRTVTAFVLACSVTMHEWRAWARAWDRVSDLTAQGEEPTALPLGYLPSRKARWRSMRLEEPLPQEHAMYAA